MESKDMAYLAAKVLDSKKAVDIKIIDVSQKSSFADYLVLATAGSERQTEALADDIDDSFAGEGIRAKGTEGRGKTGWILMDYGDVIVNIFVKEMRAKYNIEKVWGDCDIIDFGEE